MPMFPFTPMGPPYGTIGVGRSWKQGSPPYRDPKVREGESTVEQAKKKKCTNLPDGRPDFSQIQ